LTNKNKKAEVFSFGFFFIAKLEASDLTATQAEIAAVARFLV